MTKTVNISDLPPGGIKGFPSDTRLSWPITKVGEVAELHYGKSLIEDDRRSGSIPVYGTNGRTGWHDEGLADGPTVVLGRKGMGNLGVEWCQGPFWVIDTAYYTTFDTSQILPRYFYYFTDHVGLNHLKVGTSNPSLQRDVFEDQPIPLPPLPVQRRIADILGALDDKIELNRRMNRTLEDMAQTLYRHWFVDFGPFQDQPFVDSELGPIPEGWEVKTIGDVAKMRGGSTPKTSVDEYWDGGDITWFTPTDLTNSGRLYITDSSRQITEEGLNSCSTNYVPPYSLMMTSRATVGVVAFNRVRACTNQGFINVMPKEDVSRFQVYFWIDQMMPEIMARADGSTYPEISQRDFKPLPILVPPADINSGFTDKVEPLFDYIESNTLESDKLAETRDYLLPKLISGEISVEAAEEKVQTVA